MRILFVSQVFHPDVVAVAQHLTDLALHLSAQGHEVEVVCGRSGYHDPGQRAPAREVHRGVVVRRVWNSRWGKATLPRRVLTAAVFFATVGGALLWRRRPQVVVAVTVPPLLPALAALYARLFRVRFVYWCLDLNPDEAFALGLLQPGSLVGRGLEWASRGSLRSADRILAMDTAMARRVAAKGVSAKRIAVVPPWAQESDVAWVEREANPVAAEINPEGRFLVMYAGNHSPCHSLDTLLEAALRLRDREDILFCFSGGGSGQNDVRAFRDRHGLRNMLVQGYRPRAELSRVLSAADLHVVSLGPAFVGVVHPCKIYNILAVGAPFLYLGPDDGPISAIARDPRACGIVVAHGAVAETVAAIEAAVRLGRRRSRGSEMLAADFPTPRLLQQAAAVITGGEGGLVSPLRQS